MTASERKSASRENLSSPLARQAAEFKAVHDEERLQPEGITREAADREFAIIRMNDAIEQLSSLICFKDQLTPAQVNVIYGSVSPRYDEEFYPEAIRLLREGSHEEINFYSYAIEQAYHILQKLSTSLGKEKDEKQPALELQKEDFDKFLEAIVQLDGQASRCPSFRKIVGALLMIAGAIAIAVALGPVVLAAMPNVLAAGTTVLGTSATASISAALSSAAATITHSVAGSYLINVGSYLSSLGTTYMGAKAVYAAGLLGKLLAQSPVLSFAAGILGVKLGSYISDTEAKPVIKSLTDIYKKTRRMAEDRNPDIKEDIRGRPRRPADGKR